MANNYVRCSECSCVFSGDLQKCPKCGKEHIIKEDSTTKNTPVFNICD